MPLNKKNRTKTEPNIYTHIYVEKTFFVFYKYNFILYSVLFMYHSLVTLEILQNVKLPDDQKSITLLVTICGFNFCVMIYIYKCMCEWI